MSVQDNHGTNPLGISRFGATWKLPAFLVVVLAVTSSAPKPIEFFLLGVYILYGLAIATKVRQLKVPLLLGITSIGSSALVYLLYPYPIDIYGAAEELKFLGVFIIWHLLTKPLTPKSTSMQGDVLAQSFKIFIVAITLTTALQTARGLPRDSLFFGFSINAAYSILYLAAYLDRRISALWLLCSFAPIALLGSTTAIFLLSLVLMRRFARFWWIQPAIIATLAPLFLYYSLEFRGKDFLGSSFEDFDRIQILQYLNVVIQATFEPANYVFGWGIGHELVALPDSSHSVISGWFLRDFVARGFFAFSTHNEYYRIFIDYGSIGLAIILASLYKKMPLSSYAIFALAAATNTTLWSTSNILVLSAIIADYANRKSLIQGMPEHVPSKEGEAYFPPHLARS